MNKTCYVLAQVVTPGHCTSYRTGENWLEVYDNQADAQAKAELYNRHVTRDVGVSYSVIEVQRSELEGAE